MTVDIGVILVGLFVAALLFSGSGLLQWIGLVGATGLYLFSCAPAYAQQQVYTDKTGAVVGYGQKTGKQTTYVDKTGRVVGYENRMGNTSVYTSPSGSYEGAKTRSWDTTDRYGVDPAQRGRSRDDD